MRLINLSIIAIIMMSSAIIAKNTPNENIPLGKEYSSKEEYKKAMDNYFGAMESTKSKGWKPYKRYEWFMGEREDENGNIPDMIKVYRDYQEYRKKYAKVEAELMAGTEWELIGPESRVNNNLAGVGRITTAQVDPNNSNIVWAGAATGGVWKSTDRGQSWKTFPFTEFASIGIGRIAIAPSNTNTVYLATGDRSAALGVGVSTYYSFYSVGIIKTTNGGNSWSLTSPISNLQQASGAFVTGVLVHPDDEDHIYASVYDDQFGGLYRSTNGGSSWSEIFTGIRVWDIEFKPNDPNIIHFLSAPNNTTKVIATYDLDEGTVINQTQINGSYRSEIAVTADNPDHIVAIHAQTNGGLHSITKTNDGGETWSTIQDSSPNYLSSSNNGQGSGGQGFFDLCVTIDPENANLIYIGGINAYKSTNGGATFQQMMYSYQRLGNLSYVHPDIHDFAFASDGSSYICHDGGINYSTNFGVTWTDRTNGISNTQYYRFGQSTTQSDVFIAGSQDNSTWVMNGGNWRIGPGGDGFHCLVDPNNDNVMYASSNLGGTTGWIWKTNSKFASNSQGELVFGPANVAGNTATGEQPMWLAPFEIDPNNSNVLYAGHRNVWKTTNGGNSWTKSSNINSSIRSIGVSPINSNYVWAAAGNRLFRTTDGGGSWSQIYSASGGNISSIIGSHDEDDRCFITITGFRATNKVIQIDGTTDINITYSGLPNLGAVTIAEHALTGDLFVGMDAGVYRLSAGDKSWAPYSNGLPQVIISELLIHERSNKLRAATYGRGIWQVDIADCEIDQPEVLVSDEGPLCEGDERILQLNGSWDDWTWSTGETSRSIVVTEPGDYYIDVTDGKGCFARSEVINVPAPDIDDPKISFSKEEPVICGTQDSIRLTLSGFYDSIEWNTGATGRSIWVNEPGDYFVTVSDGTCNVTSDVVTIIETEAPRALEISVTDDVILRASLGDNYQWYLNGSPINGATSRNYLPVADGTYNVETTNEEGCSTLSEDFVVTWFSIDDNEFEALNVSPNPNSGFFNVKCSTGDLTIVELQISDLLGNVIFTDRLIANDGGIETSINLGNVIAGTYFLTLKSGNNIINSKIIVE